MSVNVDIYKSFGSLIDVYPTLKKTERIKHNIDLKYDLLSGDVNSAWSDVICTIGESYFKCMDKDLSVKDLKIIERLMCESSNYLDISESISLDDLLKVTDQLNGTGFIHKKLKRESKVSYE